MSPPLMEAGRLAVDDVSTPEPATHPRGIQILRAGPASRLRIAVKAALENQEVGEQVRRELRLTLH